MSNKSQTMVQKLVCLSPNFPSQEILCGLDEGWLVELVVPVLVPACRIGLLEATLPEYFLRSASFFCGDSHVETGGWEQEGWLECCLLPWCLTVVVSVELDTTRWWVQVEVCHDEARAGVLGPELQSKHVPPYPGQEGLLARLYAYGSLVIIVVLEQSSLNESPHSVAPTDVEMQAVVHSVGFVVVGAGTAASHRTVYDADFGLE